MARGLMDDVSEPEWLKAGARAALTERFEHHRSSFLQDAARILELALPDETHVVRHGHLFQKRVVESISVTYGGSAYRMEGDGADGLQAIRSHPGRHDEGSEEKINVGEWISEVGTILDGRMETHPGVRDALARFAW